MTPNKLVGVKLNNIMRVVGSITTSPDRYNLLFRCLRSLVQQDHPLDEIYLSIPEKTKYTDVMFGDLPNQITNICTPVILEYDYGSCNKIVAPLLLEQDSDTIIITFDDDYTYPCNLVSTLLHQHALYPDEAIGASGMLLGCGFLNYSVIINSDNNWNNITGFNIPPSGRIVDALCGESATLYVRNFFPGHGQSSNRFHVAETFNADLLKYSLMNEDVYYSGDLLISAYLNSRHITRRVLPNMPTAHKHIESRYRLPQPSPKTIKRAISMLEHTGLYDASQYSPVSIDETVVGRITIVALLVGLLFLAVLSFYRCENIKIFDDI